jgi:hypothetical protein
MHTYGYVCGDLCIDIGIYIAVSYLHHLSISMNLSPIYISIISIHLYVSVSSLFIYHLSICVIYLPSIYLYLFIYVDSYISQIVTVPGRKIRESRKLAHGWE